MLSLVVPIFALLSGVGLVLLGMGLLNTLLALRGVAEGFSSLQLGIIMSSYFAGYLVGILASTRIIERAGYIRAFAFSCALLAAAILLHALWANPLAWILLRILTGVGVVTLYTTIESWLNQHSSQQNRGRVFAIYMGVNLTALALAQQLLMVAPIQGATLFVISALMVILALMPVTLTRLDQPPVPKKIQVDLREIMRVSPLVTVAAAISGLAMGGYWGMLAVFASRLEMTPSAVAGFLTLSILGGAVLQMPIGRFSDSTDRRSVLLWVALGASVSGLALALLSQYVVANWGLLTLAGFVYGGFAFAVYPIAMAHLADQLQPEDVLGACATLLLIYGASAALGPAIAGQMMSYWGPPALPWLFVVTHLLLALLCRMELRSPYFLQRGTDHLVRFIPMLRTTPVALEMYPEPEPVDDAEATGAVESQP